MLVNGVPAFSSSMSAAGNLKSTAAKLLSDRSSCRCGSDRDLTPFTQQAIGVYSEPLQTKASQQLEALDIWVECAIRVAGSRGSKSASGSGDRNLDNDDKDSWTKNSALVSMRSCEAIKSSHSRRLRKFEAGWHANLARIWHSLARQ